MTKSHRLDHHTKRRICIPAFSKKLRTEALKGKDQCSPGFCEAHLPGRHLFLYTDGTLCLLHHHKVPSLLTQTTQCCLNRGAQKEHCGFLGPEYLSLLCWLFLHLFHQHITHSPSSPPPLPASPWPLLALFNRGGGSYTFVYGTPSEFPASCLPVSPTEILSQAPAGQGLIYISLTNLI